LDVNMKMVILSTKIKF